MDEIEKEKLLDDLIVEAVQKELTPEERDLLDLSKPKPPLHQDDKEALDRKLRRSAQDCTRISIGNAIQPKQVLAVHRASQRTFLTAFTEATSAGGERGLLVRASGLPSGIYDLQAFIQEGKVLQRRTLASFRILPEFTDVRMTTDALAGAAKDEIIASRPSSYEAFRERLREAKPETVLPGLEGYIVPQVKGAAVELFVKFSE